MSDLYCLKCRKYHHRNSNKCNILSLVPVTRHCRNLADRLFEIGIELLGVAHFTQLVNGSKNKYIINIHIELRHSYQIEILGRLPIKWRLYKETTSDDHTPLVVPVLAYYETYCCDGVKSVDDRVQEVVDEFVQYLNNTYDADAIQSVTMLMYD
ncbi:hypothetical protein [Clostridium sp. YIM B02500]|uniref:hypothetical protein n=1 Tax=Clostridium sp. YIM B02500 TaxID=2910681 RepID=UPI001EEED31D|nr:hypothetical protein [Clostridium sp. YIM B02500]